MNDDTEIKILRIVAEGIKYEKEDGSPELTPCTIPLLLSCEPSVKWIEFFIKKWNNSKGHNTSQGIVEVRGDKIYLNNTTLSAINLFYKDMLKNCVSIANEEEKKYEERKYEGKK